MLNQTCCSDLPIPQALYQPGMVLFPRNTMPKDSPNQPPPPTIIYKTAAKDLIDQDPRTTHLEGNLGLKLSNKQSTQVIGRPPLNIILVVAVTIETYTAATVCFIWRWPSLGHCRNAVQQWPMCNLFWPLPK